MIEEYKAGLYPYTVKDKSMQLICIEGNIGVGKSTLCLQLAKEMGAEAVLEPVLDNPYLEKYYQDPKRYALEMQFWLMSKRFEMHERAIRHIWKTGQSVVMDRSIYGDWVFAKKNWLDGNIDDVGYGAYTHHREVMNRYLLAPHVVFFLEANPEVCLDRITERDRECEQRIPLEYLRGLEVLHRELILEMRKRGSFAVEINWSEYGDVKTLAALARNKC